MTENSDPPIADMTSSGSPQPKRSSGSPQPKRSSGSPQPKRSSGSPQPKRSSGSPQPKRSSGSPQPKRSSGSPQPKRSSGSPQPKRSSGSPQPKRSSGSPQPKRSSGSPQPKRSSGSPQPKRSSGSPQPTASRDAGVCLQTRSLLYKNLLIKWRTKQQSLQELILPLLLLVLLIFISSLDPHETYGSLGTMELDPEQIFVKGLGYTPVTNATTLIMEEVANQLNLDEDPDMFSHEAELESASLDQPSSYVGVVFTDGTATSYKLRFPYSQLPLPSDYTESIANCYSTSVNCRAANYWYSGFIQLQTVIDTAIIKMQTNRDVHSELDLSVVMMGKQGVVEVQKVPRALISIYLVLAFTPFVTFLIVNVAAEKEQRLKDAMTMMGLYNTAFWLSWGLLYAVMVTTMSLLMAIIATYSQLFPNSNFFVIFLLIFLYGISSIFFSFMLTPLFKKPKLASTVGSMLTVVFGCLSLFTMLMDEFPQTLVWPLSLLSPTAFSIGIAQVVYLEAHGEGAVFSTLTSGPHPLYVPVTMLVLDCVLYLLLAVYLDQVLPGDYGIKRSVVYFLKPSYWSRRAKNYVEVSAEHDVEESATCGDDECVEPVSPEFTGKEAIRSTNNQVEVSAAHDVDDSATPGDDECVGPISPEFTGKEAIRSTNNQVEVSAAHDVDDSATPGEDECVGPVSPEFTGKEAIRSTNNQVEVSTEHDVDDSATSDEDEWFGPVSPEFTGKEAIRSTNNQVEVSAEHDVDDSATSDEDEWFEPVSPEFTGKEAIRSTNNQVEVSAAHDVDDSATPGEDECVEPVSPEFTGKEAIRSTNNQGEVSAAHDVDDSATPGEDECVEPISPEFTGKEAIRSTNNQVEVSAAHDVEESATSGEDECVGPISPEFTGKEAIRIINVHKSYKDQGSVVEALRGLTFDIYEGQITALLGHSGAGKSTLMNILCGICAPTEGWATIYGSPVAEIADGSEMKQLVGICPQFNILFDVLTVEEHLRMFAAVKGIRPSSVSKEVNKVLKDLDLEKIQAAQAKNLSAGQKRKLSVGLAILGDPKILLLDEPTAGMDLCSRHQVWSLLRSRRAGRVTVLSTHFMDEADILADRKAVISQGKLKCVGSSMYLKTKCGVGYHLRMSVSEGCKAEDITSLVQKHVSEAKLSKRHEADLTFTLPFESRDTFSGLFSALDSQPDLGIISYGVSMTTLEDVFLRLEAEAEVDQGDYDVFHREQGEEEGDHASQEDTDQRLLPFPENKAAVSGGALWCQQFSTVAWLHLLNMHRERKAYVYVLALFLVFVLVLLGLSLVTGNIQLHSPELQFQPVYLLRRNQPPQRFATSLLVLNSSDSDISDFVHNLESQDIIVEMMTHGDYMSAAPHSAAINVTGSNKGFRYSIGFNSTTVHSLPMAVNVLSNALLRGLNGTGRIQTWTKPFEYRIPDSISYTLMYIEAIILGMLAAGMPAYFAMAHTRDREIKCRSTLRISGLVPSAYWCGQAAVDIPLYYIILSSMTTLLFSFHVGNLLSSSNLITPGNLIAVILCIVGHGPAMILLTYVSSFGFARVQSNRDFFSVISMMVCVLSASMVQLSYVNMNQDLTRNLHNVLCMLNPLYPLMGCLNCITKATFIPTMHEENFLWKSLIIAVIAPYLQIILLLVLLHWLEISYGGGDSKRGQLCCRTWTKSNPKVENDPEEGVEEDRDVQMEKVRVKEALACQSSEEKPAVVVSDLRKQYGGRGKGASFNRKRKEAAKNVSFCVRKGEVLGLLGPNGAGKTTIMHMLSGDTEPSTGQVLMGDYSTEVRPMDCRLKHMGYCPQVNPLWPRITLQEHLQIYAAVKGLRGRDVPGIIKRVANALELQGHLDQQAKNLSAGLKRKLCFALSMIGNPPVVLLDEPSSGMDPESKQRVWRAIRAAFKNRQRGAILTTHYMEEAEAVCDRVAIMVSGELRCIGSIQHLKGKYGRVYSLEVKLQEELTEAQKVALLHQDILQIFPHAARQESFSTLMVYKIPTEDVKSLAECFSKLESTKQTFGFEDYNFSQSTLEQVFMEFAKEQKSEEEEVGSLSTIFQWRRKAGSASADPDSVVTQL